MATSNRSSGGLRLRAVKTKAAASEAEEPLNSEPVEEPVTPVGRMFQEEVLQCYVLCTIGFKVAIDLEQMRNTLQQTLLKHKRFRSVVENYGKDKATWKQVGVNVNDHVQEVFVSEEEATSPTIVEDISSKLGSEPPLDPLQPLWKALILNVKRRDSIGHLILRMHHALGDGTSLMSLLVACTRQMANPDSLPTIPGQAGSSSEGASPSWPTKKSKGGIFGSFLRGCKVFANTVLHVGEFGAMIISVKDSQTPIKAGPQADLGPHRFCFSDEISLDDVADVRRAIGDTTINHVIMSIVAAGLGKYINTRDDTIDLTKVRVRGLAFVNLRKAPGLQELEAMMRTGSKAPWGNCMGYVLVPLHVEPLSDPLDRVRRMRSMLNNKKLSFEAAASYSNARALVALAGYKATALLSKRACNQTSITVSNLVGPAQEVTLGGYPISYVVPSVSGTPQSMTLDAVTYNGKLRFVAWIASDVIPDPETMFRCFMDAFSEIHKASK